MVLPISTFLLTTFTFVSCRKMDRLVAPAGDYELTEKFLTLPPMTTPQVKRIAQKLKTLNEKHGFLTTIAKQNGFAMWDKPITSNTAKSKKVAARSATASDTIIFIPLVLENTQYVNAFILARFNDSISLKLYRANDYSSYSFGTLEDSTTNAEKFAIQFMLLDFETFGHANFKVLDDRLFKDESLPTTTHTKARKVHVKHHQSSNLRRGSGFEIWEYDVCTSSTNLKCSANTACCTQAGVSPGACSACEQVCWIATTTCVRTSIMVAVDDGWYPSGGGSTGEGGGGGDGGTTEPTQCNPTPLLDNGLPPCPKGSKDGWLPTLSPPNPCDKVKTMATDAGNAVYIQKVKDLATAQNQNLGYEKSVSLIDGATPNIVEASGTTASAYVTLPSLPSGQQYKSIAHTHPNTAGGTYSIFSYGDLSRLCELMFEGQLEAGTFVAFLSTYKGAHYAFTITDKTKFEDFFYYFLYSGRPGGDNVKKFHSLNKAMALRAKYFLNEMH